MNKVGSVAPHSFLMPGQNVQFVHTAFELFGQFCDFRFQRRYFRWCAGTLCESFQFFWRDPVAGSVAVEQNIEPLLPVLFGGGDKGYLLLVFGPVGAQFSVLLFLRVAVEDA